MGSTCRLGAPASIIRWVLRPAAILWSKIPVHCSLCGQPNAGASVARGEAAAWCSHCQRVFEVPLFRGPSWVTGVLGVLIINLQGM
jgi:hypothetical protein